MGLGGNLTFLFKAALMISDAKMKTPWVGDPRSQAVCRNTVNGSAVIRAHARGSQMNGPPDSSHRDLLK